MIGTRFDGIEIAALTHYAVFANSGGRFRSRDETWRA